MKHFITCFFMFWMLSLVAQNKEVLYGMEEVPQSMLLNPGSKVSFKYHFGIPFLSQIHFNGGSSGVSVYDIFKDSNDDINTRIRNKIFELKNTDFFTVTQQLDILNFGWKSKKEIYFSGGVYQELDFILYFPRDLAILAWDGNRDYIGREFDLGEINTTGELLTIYHFGLNKKVNKKLVLGIRGKIYSSMISYRSTNNRGTFVTRISETDNNIYEHIVINGDITVNTSGIASLKDLDGSSQVISEIFSRAFFGGNLGIGVDLGFTYDINEKWTASASILDVGPIFYKKDVETYNVNGSYTLDGIELLFPPLSEGEAAPPYYEDLIDEIEDTFPVDTIHNSYTQFRPAKLYASLNYNFGKPISRNAECNCLDMGGNTKLNQSIGFQYYSMFRPKGPQMAATLFYYRRLSDYITIKGTYTVDSYSYSNIGLGFVADLGKVNFYITADNLIWYENIAKAKSLSLQLGFNIIFDEE